jgi:hypothetical protein
MNMNEQMAVWKKAPAAVRVKRFMFTAFVASP